MLNICTTCFNLNNATFFPTKCIDVSLVILSKNTDHFQRVYTFSGDALFFSVRCKLIFKITSTKTNAVLPTTLTQGRQYALLTILYQNSADFSCILRTAQFPALYLLRSTLPQHNLTRRLSGLFVETLIVVNFVSL